MTYSMGDGDKLKVRLSQVRDAILSHTDVMLKLAAEVLQDGDTDAASDILHCARKIKETIQELREKTQ